MEHEIAKG